jgi:hypothetical protein
MFGLKFTIVRRFITLNALVAASALASLVLVPSSARAEVPGSTRYGPFGLYDSRSKYDTNWFPEPMRSDESDTDQELRLNYFHAEKTDHRQDEATLEVEKSFGMVSFEIEVPYERDEETTADGKERAEGIGAPELSARGPFFQYVSPEKFFDYTFGGRVEVAIATGSEVAQDTEVVWGLFQTIGLGEHFSVQTSVGYSSLYGPGEDGGTRSLESAAIFGYNIDITNSPIVRITPELELDGETALNKGESGSTEFTGTLGALISFDSIRWGQPKFLAGYVFPINDTARDDFNWGVTVSLILEY